MLRSLLLGITGGLCSFAASGWIVYSLLWWLTKQDAIPRSNGTVGVVVGGVWCYSVGLFSGGVIGVSTAVLIVLFFQRRQRREVSVRNTP